MKKVLDWILIILSLAGNVFGILSLLTLTGAANIFGFLLNFDHILYGYIIVVASMTIGIMSFNIFAGRRKGAAKVILSIGITTYSTILTIPLFLTFVLCLIQKMGVKFTGFIEGFVKPIYDDLISIFTPNWAQYLIFIGGIILGAIFLAVPIVMCVKSLKPKKEKQKKLRKKDDEFALD